MNRLIAMTLSLMVVFAWAGARAQTPARDNVAGRGEVEAVRGRVFAAETGEVLRRAEVILHASRFGEARVAYTDEQGRYEFNGVQVGRHLLRASKAGYLTRHYGQRTPFDTGIELDVEGSRAVEGVDLHLPKAASLSIRVFDEVGEPIAQAGVEVLRAVSHITGRRLVIAAGANPSDMTNDLGEVRIHGLPPGDYFVRVSAPNVGMGSGGRGTFIQVYYPGTPHESSAESLTVAVGQEAAVALALPVSTRTGGTPLATISGVLRGEDGRPIDSRNFVMLHERLVLGVPRVLIRFLETKPDGSFRVENVDPNIYTLMLVPGQGLRPGAPLENNESASISVRVEGKDVSGLVLTATRAGTARGRIRFDEDVPPQRLPRSLKFWALGDIAVSQSWLQSPQFPGGVGAIWGSGIWTLKDDWSFELREIAGGLRFFRPTVGDVGGWFLKTVILDGRDITDVPIDFDVVKDVSDLQIIMTRKRTTITGTVVDELDQPISSYTAVVFSEQSESWTTFSRSVASGRSDQQGEFRIQGLSPGRYLAAAVEFLEPGNEYDPAFLGRLRAEARPITLLEGEETKTMLRLFRR
jgi:protocatechuate 3,4-dioxygenase beta subunit